VSAAFWVALQFLTCLPVPHRVPHTEQTLGWSVVMYPLVGLVIGLLLTLTAIGFNLAEKAALSAALVLALWVLITGGLHLDGLADCTDAWAGGLGSRERTLELMKDPHAGTMAVVALVLVLLVKFAALIHLMDNQVVLACLSAPVLGRTAIVVLLLTTPYVRPRGLGSELAAHLPQRPAIIATGAALLSTLYWLGPIPLLAAAGALLCLRRLMLQRLGGCTGDTLGASVEIVETVALAAAVFVVP
jgi:adenosylcobinamide-GDP ribazoletransferase